MDVEETKALKDVIELVSAINAKIAELKEQGAEARELMALAMDQIEIMERELMARTESERRQRALVGRLQHDLMEARQLIVRLRSDLADSHPSP